MYTKMQVVFDAAEPEKLAEFWELALGYVVEPPPEGFESWEQFAASIGMPEEEFGEVASRIDPLAWQTDDVRGSSVTLRDPEGNEFCVS